MTSHHHPKNAEALPATRNQLNYLRSLSEAAGCTFRTPIDRKDASAQITELRTRRPDRDTLVSERLIEREPVEPHPAGAFRPGEIAGYGATARWA